MAQINFLQWNSKSMRHKKHEISYLINKYQPTVFAVAETWLKPGSRFRVPGYSCLRDDRDDGYGGCALLVNRAISFSQISLPSHSPDFNIIAVKALNITFISVYIPRPNSTIISDLNSILSTISGSLVILGDFNCHHSMWGSHYCDPTSSLLLDVFDTSNICVLNDGSPTRRVSPLQHPSAVDLSLSSSNIASLLSWKVLSSTLGSDHYPILISMPQHSQNPKTSSPLLKHKISQADWHLFSLLTKRKIESLPPVDNNNYLSLYSDFINALISSADESIPLKKSSLPKMSSPPWWDTECTDAIRRRKESENGFSRNPNMDNYISLQKTCAQTKKLLAKKKKDGWRSFCEELAPKTPLSLIWRKIKAFRGSLSDTYNVSSNDPSWVENFLDKLAPPYVPSEDCLPSYCPPPRSPDKMDDPFSFAELHSVLSNLKDSTPGIDGIPYSFVTKSSNSAKLFLLDIMNKVFVTGVVPESWKHQIVIPILKPGKNPSDPSSYRPIALSSVLAKIFEHLIKNRLEWILENRSILSESQFGFRRGMGTLDSLSTLSSQIRLAFSQEEHVIGVFLDINSAYDNVQLHLLRQKMLNLSIPRMLVNVICNLFMARTISVRLNDSLLPSRLIWKGLPQGSVLSPLLYNLYTYDLSKSVDSFCNILQYADDLALYVSSSSFSTCCARLNSALMYFGDWISDHGLSLSISKSNVVVFSRKRIIPDIEILFQDQLIPVQDKVKFLGVVLDSKLSGIHHLNHIVSKCEKNINALRALSGVWWGSHPYSQKLLYNSIIRSHLDYATFILEPCNKLALCKLDKIQTKCLRILSGAMKSSPNNALQVECLDPPLHLRRQFLADRYFFHISQYSNHPLLSILRSLSQLISSSSYWSHKDLPCLLKSFIKLTELPHPILQFSKNPLFSVPFEALIYDPPVFLNLGIEKNSVGADEKLNNILDTKWNNWLTIYTDASKLSNDDYVGVAVWIPKYKVILNFKCPPSTTIFSAEALAIWEALSYVESHKLDKTVILSDSLSCLQDILKVPFRSNNNFFITLKIRELLFSCKSQNIELVLAWIPGHSGIRGNETVDLCAKEAVHTGWDKHSNSFARDLRILARLQMINRWNEIWGNSRNQKGKHYGNIQPSIPAKPWFFRYRKANKQTTSTIIRLRLGHVCSPVFLAKIRVRDHSLCECGLEDGTLDHLFFNCPRLSHSLYDILPHNIPRPINFCSLLTLTNTSFIELLSKFINTHKIRL